MRRVDGTLCMRCMLVSAAGMKEIEKGKTQKAELKE